MRVGESCVRLFVSVDLVGSTAFKNKREADTKTSSSPGPPWADVFYTFYKGFPKMFERELDRKRLRTHVQPKLVKTIGDEVLLQTPIDSSADAKDVVRFLARALVSYKKTNLPDAPLLLKATAWIAGFPINNHHVRFEDEGGARGGEDFIGPSIDTGFRISKLASPSKLMVSVDLALLLLAGDDAVDLYFDGTESLVGVLGGRPYPIIWCKVLGDHSALHDAELKLVKHEPMKTELRTYCEEYVRSCDGTWLIVPYLSNDPAFRAMPKWHEAVRQTWDQVDTRNLRTGPDDGGSGDGTAAPRRRGRKAPAAPTAPKPPKRNAPGDPDP
jgi:hypothetical protein